MTTEGAVMIVVIIDDVSFPQSQRHSISSLQLQIDRIPRGAEVLRVFRSCKNMLVVLHQNNCGVTSSNSEEIKVVHSSDRGSEDPCGGLLQF